jgi:hypothetical protein
MGKGGETHLVEEFMVVHEYALNQLKSKCLGKVFELYESWAFFITKQTEVLEDSKCVTCSRTEHLCHPDQKGYRLKLISEQHVVIFLYDLVDNEHDQLTQCHCCHG